VYLLDEEWVKGVRVFYMLTVSGGIICAILFGFGLRLKDHLKLNIALSIITTVATIYIVETTLQYSSRQINQLSETLSPPELRLAAREGFIDKRTKEEVLKDFQKDNIAAHITFLPGILLTDYPTKGGLPTRGGMIFPFGNISDRMTICCNESGTWLTYVSDKYGFHNSNEVYHNDIVDAVAIGDSFTEGWAVPSKENISSVLMKAGLNVVNLGRGANGPLLEYAILKEYVGALKPRIIFWVYFENDLENLSHELNSDLLIRYLNEDSYTQELISRQQEINQVLITYIGKKRQELDNREHVRRQQLEIANREEFASKQIIRVLKLRNIREITNLVPESRIVDVTPPQELSPKDDVPSESFQLAYYQNIFKEILGKADQFVSTWNGRLYFVYLPSGGTGNGEVHPWREPVMSAVTELNIPIIDIEHQVFVPHQQPFSLFAFEKPPFGHYNVNGYRLVAEAIAERLREDGLLQ
jgi:hypothetical protein